MNRVVVLFITIFLIICTLDFGTAYIRKQHGRSQNAVDVDNPEEANGPDETVNYGKHHKQSRQCWMQLDSKKHFEIMDELDKNYADVRKEYQDAAEKDKFDEQMLEVMIKTRGAAEREIQKAAGDSGLIPAGINLGGYVMMRMPNSVLFFHRMKLRNDTHFRVTSLHNDLDNMTLAARLSLNDLHLIGSFDRSITEKDPSVLFYTPTYGQVEILLKNVQYKCEGRFRLLKDRLTIELIISDMEFDDALLVYLNNVTNEAIRIRKENIDGFMVRLKADLDKWIRDYFNDYLMYFGVISDRGNNKFQQYDKRRAAELNDYTDNVINVITQRLQEIKADSVTLPKFTIFTSNSMELLLKNGVLRGLDSMYRRSVATGKKEGNVHKVDAVVGFSNLKVIYQYEALLTTNAPVLSGEIILSADELTAHMGVVATTGSESVDIQFEFLEQAKPESLTVEGAANRMISNFKYVLEQHVIAIMTNTLLYNIKMLETLTRCVPLLNSHQDANIEDGDNKQNDSLNELENQDDNIKGGQDSNKANVEEILSAKENDTTDTTDTIINTENYVEITTNMAIENSYELTNPPIENDYEDNNPKDKKTQEEDNNIFEGFGNSTDNKIILVEEDSANIEIPSNENQNKGKIHVQYIKNLTLSKIE